MTVIEALASVFGILMGSSNSLQAYKIFKTKSAKDISLISYMFLFLGAVVWLIYGIDLKNLPIIIANSFGVVFVSLVLIGRLAYGRTN